MIAWWLVRMALADVMPPMPDCPVGSEVARSHGGGWCRPATSCEATGSCEEGTCEPIGLCVHTEERSSGGRRSDVPARRRQVTIVTGVCATDDDCARTGATCDLHRRCLPSAPPEPKRVDPPPEPVQAPPPAEVGGCGCVSVGTMAPLAGLLALLGALVRPRRRGSSPPGRLRV